MNPRRGSQQLGAEANNSSIV